MSVYFIIDSSIGIVAFCDSYSKAYDMATEYVQSNFPYETLEECEDVWIDEQQPDTWIW